MKPSKPWAPECDQDVPVITPRRILDARWRCMLGRWSLDVWTEDEHGLKRCEQYYPHQDRRN